MILFTSEREFFVASFQESHGLLLFRSRRSNDFSTRVDILFQDVRALELRMWHEGLTIAEEGPNFLKGRTSNPLPIVEHGLTIYSVTSKESSGYVLGGIMRHCEDNKMGSEPSALIEAPLN